MKRETSGIRRWIVSGDYQVPYHDKRSLRAFEKFMAAHRWDGYLNLGDFQDFDYISSYNKDNLRAVQGKKFEIDYEIANEILDRHQKIVRANNKEARFVLLEGNHEERVERYLNANPLLEGMVEVEVGLRLKERGFKWVRSWSKGEMFSIGHARFVHGVYTNKYHAAKMVDAFGVSVFYGHVHDMMCYPRVHKGKKDLQVGQSLGCLCEEQQSYMKGKPTNWQQGFGVFYFNDDGTYTYYTPRIINHKFIGPDGICYSG